MALAFINRFGEPQKRTNPREGIETKYPTCFRRNTHSTRQKRTNPREGIETQTVLPVHYFRQSVRKERIPVRGLKRTSVHLTLLGWKLADQISQKRTNPREGIETMAWIPSPLETD